MARDRRPSVAEIQTRLYERQRAQEAAEAECREALRDKGCHFRKEPKSIHSHAGGRFGSVEKESAGKGYLNKAQPYTYTRDTPPATRPGRWRQRG